MRAKTTGLDAILRPRSIAVVGATGRAGSIGREVLKNLVASGFTGKVFPVNRARDVVLSMKAYKRVSEIPDEVDLAVVVVPKRAVPSVVEDCGKKGVRGLVIVTAGFREAGGAGVALEQKLARGLARYGMRAVGPNCMGVIHTDPSVRMNASFARISPPPGNVAFLSQSGALGEAILGRAAQLGLGISLFASLGNQTDVTATDLLEALEHDARTEVILLYQESFGDPDAFPHVAKRVARRKPIIAVKSGRTAAGARAAFSHTGSLAGAEVAVDALFDECGIVRVASVEQLFDVARGFSNQPLPAGARVGIVTNAGGPGILAADACAGLGLAVPAFSDRTVRALRPRLNPDASLRNPIDLIASAGPGDYAAALPHVLADPNVDALLVIFVPPVMIDAPEVARAVVTARASAPDKPVLACFMAFGEGAEEAIRILTAARIPAYAFPESAAHALSAMASYSAWRRRDGGRVPARRVDRARAARVLARVRKAGQARMRDGFELLTAYRIPVADVRFVTSLEQALGAAADIGYPVVLKLDAPDLTHKTEAGAVAPDLRDEAELVRAYRRMPVRRGAEVAVQKMVRGARETALGTVTDAAFGKLVMFGLGGIHVEVFRDVAFKVHPLTDVDAHELLGRIRGAALLDGVRGEPPVDREVLVDALLGLSRLVADFPELAEIEINPFLAAPRGSPSAAVDVRLRLSDSAPRLRAPRRKSKP